MTTEFLSTPMPSPDLATVVEGSFREFLKTGTLLKDYAAIYEIPETEQRFLISQSGADDPVTFVDEGVAMRLGSHQRHIIISGYTINGPVKVILSEDTEFVIKQQLAIGD